MWVNMCGCELRRQRQDEEDLKRRSADSMQRRFIHPGYGRLSVITSVRICVNSVWRDAGSGAVPRHVSARVQAVGAPIHPSNPIPA
jgi:hypothetical protein